MLRIVPCSISDANEYVRQVHRTHRTPRRAFFAVACAAGDEICGVAIASRPVARCLDDGLTIEISRCTTNGTKNACSMLYRAIWRAARELGWKRCITYTEVSETGVSLRAAGFRVVGETRARTWNCLTRPRVDRTPNQLRFRWELVA